MRGDRCSAASVSPLRGPSPVGETSDELVVAIALDNNFDAGEGPRIELSMAPCGVFLMAALPLVAGRRFALRHKAIGIAILGACDESASFDTEWP